MNSKSRVFPDPRTIIEERNARDEPARIFAALTVDVREAINLWAEPEISTYGRVHTNNHRAAVMLIDALREDGYAADFHWHGSKPGVDNGHFVQFALEVSQLNRAHHDPRR